MDLAMDPALTARLEAVRKAHAPIDDAINKGERVDIPSLGTLAGAVGAFLDAVDSYLKPLPALDAKEAA
ncbi:hypothetical protein [Streptomyces sp. NPDC088794]|uniref:hypothetical protein n=1 Tax=Streptomyces sp. NPDC088794 TaxID=3365902 RepID=UPI0037F396F2